MEGSLNRLTPAVVLIVAAVVVMLAFAERLPCAQTVPSPTGPQLNWANNRPFTDYCYSDVIALYGADHISDAGEFPYKTSWVENPGTPQAERHWVEYPVLTGLFMYANAELTGIYADLHADGIVPARAAVVIYFWLCAIFLALAWLCVVGAVRRLAGGDLRPALLTALSPLVIDQLLTNFDALAVALALGGLLAYDRRRPVLAGVLLGLGGAAKLYPLLLLIPLLALCLRARDGRAAGRTLGGAVAGWAAVNVPIAVLYPHGWGFFFRFSQDRGPGLESIYSILDNLAGWRGLDPTIATGSAPGTLNAVSVGAFFVCALLVCLLALRAPQPPRIASLCFLLITAFLLTNKVYSEQYSLWLVPLAALALPRPRLIVPWMLLDALVWVPTMLYQRGAASLDLFQSVVCLRDLALVLLCAVVVRDALHPERDPVRSRLTVTIGPDTVRR